MMKSILENVILNQENEALTATVSDLMKKNEELKEIIHTVLAENTKLEMKNAHLMEIIGGLEEEIEELDNECNRLSDELEEDESKVIHYIAVSLDVNYCIPIVSENPVEASQELLKKCLAKGIPYGGFKVFERSELL